MRGPRKVLFFLLVPFLFVLGCDLATSIDYDREADFSQISTFGWTGKQHPEINDLVHNRIVNSLRTQLEAKGIDEVDSNPDVLVTYYGDDNERTVIDTNHFGYGMGPGWGWGGGMGMAGMGSSTTTVRTYKEGTIIVDMYRAEDKQLVWRGTVTGTISDNPQKNEKNIVKGIAKLFEKYPPTPGKS